MEKKLKIVVYKSGNSIIEQIRNMDAEVVISPNLPQNGVIAELYEDDVLLAQFFTEQSLMVLAVFFGVNVLAEPERDPNEITPLAWYDGCAPPNYRHCGSNCGDGLKYGGGTPVNASDACCRGHDRCWANFGSWDPCCDKELLDCLARANDAPVIRAVAEAVFRSNANKCK